MKNVSLRSVLLASLLFSGFVLATSCKEEKSDINNDPNETGMGEYGNDSESTGTDSGMETGTASDTTTTNGTGNNSGTGTGSNGGSGTGSGNDTESGMGGRPTVPGGTQ